MLVKLRFEVPLAPSQKQSQSCSISSRWSTKNQVVHEQNFKDNLSRTCHVNSQQNGECWTWNQRSQVQSSPEVTFCKLNLLLSCSKVSDANIGIIVNVVCLRKTQIPILNLWEPRRKVVESCYLSIHSSLPNQQQNNQTHKTQSIWMYFLEMLKYCQHFLPWTFFVKTDLRIINLLWNSC